MRIRGRISAGEVLVLAILMLITAWIFSAVIWQMVYNVEQSDYVKHINFAHDMIERNQFATAHLMYQVLTIGLSKLSRQTLEVSGGIVAIIFYVITVLMLYALLRMVLNGKGWGSWLVSAGGALALLLVTPITLLTLPNQNLYFGYIGINVVHNPTMVMLKPFALLLTLFAVAVLDQSVHLTTRSVIAGMLLAFLSVFAKPNAALILLPALLLIVAYRRARRQPIDLKSLIILLIVPLVVFLALDYIGQFLLVDSDGGGILFAPLLTVYNYDREIARLPIKFLLSILFPLIVTLVYHQDAIEDFPLKLTWLMFGIGAAQMYLLAEGGDRMRDGNFWWSAQIGLFILFVIAALFWLRQFKQRRSWREWLCLGIFVLHLISGIIYFIVELSATGMFAWW